jgi:hypothetical protein
MVRCDLGPGKRTGQRGEAALVMVDEREDQEKQGWEEDEIGR